MDRSTAPSTGTCPQCQGHRFTLEQLEQLEGRIRYLKRPCPLCGPTFTYVVSPESTFSASVELIPDPCAPSD